jgi:putative hemolysin
LINSIFDFGELTVGKIMIPRPKINALPLSISEAEMLERVVSSPHTRFPVYEGTLDNIVGVVHLKDVVEQQLEKQPFDLTTMMHETPYIPETTSAEALLATFKTTRVHMAVVVDEYGGTAGIVTLEDLIEEIVGEVRDEFDTHEPEPITVVEPGHILALGTVRLDEIAEYVDLGEQEEDVDTIGGLMISRLNLPPSLGDELKLDGITLRVEQVDGLAIERVSILFPPKDKQESGK